MVSDPTQRIYSTTFACWFNSDGIWIMGTSSALGFGKAFHAEEGHPHWGSNTRQHLWRHSVSFFAYMFLYVSESHLLFQWSILWFDANFQCKFLNLYSFWLIKYLLNFSHVECPSNLGICSLEIMLIVEDIHWKSSFCSLLVKFSFQITSSYFEEIMNYAISIGTSSYPYISLQKD